ncbi:ABC-ATPase domain-containing protein [Nesterenkonia sp. DZ6]|uniref:ABC-ATPase domain-containing protein n=1 Tax=Nesterenkonia sp. DZ6 TaxID=2901229 RepID=UPI001F4D312D|nr:ABC-ATPase domain-containing protein [Nesterenkonia sp. DZ6]MCH8560789.1 ABC-ATPase domain-containing protein [Nesterenkonia sp. DZ6]
MNDQQTLQQTLTAIDGRGYASYRQLSGRYALGRFTLSVDKVQVDPFAPPSLMRISLRRDDAGLPAELLDDRLGRIAASDFLTRAFADAVAASPAEGISIGRPGQQVLERTSVVITEELITARLFVALPAAGRKALGRKAARLLTETLPGLAESSLLHASLDQDALRSHVTLLRDQEDLRTQLTAAKLISFAADGSVLPRQAGDSDLPLGDGAVEFTSPEALRRSFTLPSGREVAGMGVPEGVTVIVGGGYHGKSTLLRAIERGVYPHIAGDGREWVITGASAVSIRAEDGRSAAGVDISPFISGLPSGADTRSFSSTNASGSTSQATNLVEAVEAGARALLIDEDTSATNFMIRDDRMRQLIPAEREPITPFVDRVRPLFTERGVSTVLVAGGSGAFFQVADQVIALQDYTLREVTAEAHRIAEDHQTTTARPAASSTSAAATDPPAAELPVETVFTDVPPRVPRRASLHPAKKTKPARSRGHRVIQYGREDVDLTAVAQLVDPAQTEALAKALDRLAEQADGERDIPTLVAALVDRIDAEGLDALSPRRGHPGHLARPRPHEIHAAINRYRGLILH